MKKVFFAIIILLFFVGCKKSSDTYPYNVVIKVRDIESWLSVSGAKVVISISDYINQTPIDSSITNADGNVFFTTSQNLTMLRVNPTKSGYMIVEGFSTIDPIYKCDIRLGKPSFIKLNIHKQGIYNNFDSILVKLKGLNTGPSGLFSGQYNIFYTNKANTPDTLFNLNTFYQPFTSKMYVQWDIIRNGSVLSTQTDSTDLIQYGTKNYDLTY